MGELPPELVPVAFAKGFIDAAKSENKKSEAQVEQKLQNITPPAEKQTSPPKENIVQTKPTTPERSKLNQIAAGEKLKSVMNSTPLRPDTVRPLPRPATPVRKTA